VNNDAVDRIRSIRCRSGPRTSPVAGLVSPSNSDDGIVDLLAGEPPASGAIRSRRGDQGIAEEVAIASAFLDRVQCREPQRVQPIP
jgi:hypothetical protein